MRLWRHLKMENEKPDRRPELLISTEEKLADMLDLDLREFDRDVEIALTRIGDDWERKYELHCMVQQEMVNRGWVCSDEESPE